MYGGEVQVGQGAASGGHGWVGYLRESDHEWIPVVDGRDKVYQKWSFKNGPPG